MFDPLSLTKQSVKMVVFLRKRSHNQLPTRRCTKDNNYLSPQRSTMVC